MATLAPAPGVLMVCMGNICRSPSAEAVLRASIERAPDHAQLAHTYIDSAGTHDYHVGEPPDPRSQRHALRRGYDLSALRARQVQGQDFQRFDLILAMDEGNLKLLQARCPPAQRHKLALLMDFAPPRLGREVPDPYYGKSEDFEMVLDLLESACEGLLTHLRHLIGRS